MVDPVAIDALHAAATYLMLVTGAAAFVALQWLYAPYGRYSRGGWWGPLINAKVAWMVWESPALLIPAYMLAASPGLLPALLADPLSKRSLMAAAFLAHYVYRAIVFPLRTRSGKPAPLSIVLLGMTFCVWNGLLQGWHIVHQVPADARATPAVAAGLALWAVGWLGVMRADAALAALRKPGETGYKIPRGGLFEYVSAANYCSEMVEWAGYALAGWSLPTAAFAFFTACNLLPRGVRHHAWYLAKFEEYPKARRAVVPFLW
ncbi:hypothetical protein FOA52_009337 [Chlamydomonas sp. UWO 241]|nr:hypothetical protein FOA52_009337 [Chlamydomonas sp. UWO 241]